jgi:glycosyltransferase involved in cell wall biosynthesis
MTLTEFWFFCPIGSLFNEAGRICPGTEVVSATDCLTCFVGLGGTLRRIPCGKHLPPRLIASALQMLDRGNVSRQAVPHRFADCSRSLSERKDFLKKLRDAVDVFFALNDWEKNFYVEHGFNSARIMSVTPTVRSVAESALKKVPRDGRIRIGFIGAMVRYKGIETLIDGFRRANLGERATLELWGDDRSDPDFRKKLVCQIGEAPDIFLRGRFGDDQLDAIFSRLDLLAIPSLSMETGPLVLFESFAHRTPALCSNHGGMPQYVRHGENGFLFQPGDSADCARVLREIARRDAVLDEMGERTQLPRSLDEFLDDHEAVYRRLGRDRSAAEEVAR